MPSIAPPEPTRTRPTETRAVLVARGLAKRYGSVRALDGLDLVLAGGITGLLGPNGAGKTTLIQHVLGLVRADEGSLAVLGHDPRSASGRRLVRALVGYMPEGDCLLPGRNAVETCTVLARLSGLSRADERSRAHEVLDYVGLEEQRYRPAVTYSTGMKQRLKLAQALVHDPALLLLDEPTNGLDPRGRREMLELVVDLGTQRGKDVLLCSHLPQDVERTCSAVAVLHRGRVQAQGTIEEMTRTAGGSVRIETLGDAEALAAALAADGLAPVREPSGALRSEGQSDDVGLIFAAAARVGAALRAVTPLRTSLEAVFMSAMREANAERAQRAAST
jgi:ABC-2 type transport system ATP-binding protein